MSDLIVFEAEVHVVPVKAMDHQGLDQYMGRYNEVDPRIREMKYRRPMETEFRLRLGHLQDGMTTQGIRGLGLWRQGRKHVDLPELLLLGRYRLELPKKGRVLAFRSLTVMRGKQCAAAICRIQEERQLNVISPDKKGYWPAGTAILVQES